jgi:hypothetical protein
LNFQKLLKEWNHGEQPAVSPAKELDMTPVFLPLIASLFVFGGLFTYTLWEADERANWERAHAGKLRTRAPKLIRRTALWSIYMGQMAVPGGLLGLFGTLFAGIGLLSIPGMILAIRIWRLSAALLRRAPKAEQEARDLARFAVWLNVVGVAIAVVFFMLVPTAETAIVSLTLIAYAGVSFAHANAMQRCAKLLAAERRLDEEAAAKRAAATFVNDPFRSVPHLGHR